MSVDDSADGVFPVYFAEGVRRPVDLLNDRGFECGDGIFETMLYENGRVPLLDYHMSRMQQGCLRLGFDYSERKARLELGEALNCVAGGGCAKVRMTVTRGIGGGGSYPESNSIAKGYIAISPIPSGSSVHEVALIPACKPLPCNPGLAGVKHLNRLSYIVGALGVARHHDEEIYYCDSGNNIIETMHHNIFFVGEDAVFTPKLDGAGVAGVMRQVLLEKVFPRIGVSCMEKHICIEEVGNYQAAFLTNAVRGVVPVRHLAGHSFDSKPICEILTQHLERFKSEI